MDRLLKALADGLTQKQACLASGISESTLSNWKEQHSELEERLASAREQARQKALAVIKAAGEAGDWRASEGFLRMSFQADYRKGDTNVNVTAVATSQQAVVCTEQERQKLIAHRNFILTLEGNKPNEELLADAIHAAREGRYQDASLKLEMAFVQSARNAHNAGNFDPEVKRRMELVEKQHRVRAQLEAPRIVNTNHSIM